MSVLVSVLRSPLFPKLPDSLHPYVSVLFSVRRSSPFPKLSDNPHSCVSVLFSVWISPVFPKLPDTEGASSAKTMRGDSVTKFKSDLLAYLAAYRAAALAQWEQHIEQHDFSAAK